MNHRSVYRALLLAYPKSFRHEYGESMLQLFSDQLRDDGGRAWLIALPDLVRTAPTQRIEAFMQSSALRKVVVLVLVVAGGVAAARGTGGFGAVAIATALLIALVLTQRRFIASMPVGERAPLRHAVVQTWWAPIAAVEGVLLVVAAVGTVFEAHNLGGRIFGTAFLFAFGATMLLGLMRRPFAREAGNTMILIATLPLFPFFWLVVPPLVGMLIWIGVITSGFNDRAEPLPL